jgi:hypothetical protein
MDQGEVCRIGAAATQAASLKATELLGFWRCRAGVLGDAPPAPRRVWVGHFAALQIDD